MPAHNADNDKQTREPSIAHRKRGRQQQHDAAGDIAVKNANRTREPKISPTDIEVFARRAESADEPLIQALIDQCGLPLFPNQNFLILFEYSFFCITICSKEDQDQARVIGFAAFSDHPVHLEFTVDRWDAVLPADTNVIPATALFVHYFVTRKRYQVKALECALRTAFRALPYLERCVITLPVEVELDAYIGKLFSIKFHVACNEQKFCVFSCPRDALYLPLLIRRSKVEDSDDIERCIREEALAELQQRYGRYWLAELIDITTTKGLFNCVTACARWSGENRPVAFFYGTTGDINADLLVHTYYTEIFDNFMPRTRRRREKTIAQPNSVQKPVSPFGSNGNASAAYNNQSLPTVQPTPRTGASPAALVVGSRPQTATVSNKSPVNVSNTPSPTVQLKHPTNTQSDETEPSSADDDEPPLKTDNLGVDEFEAKPLHQDGGGSQKTNLYATRDEKQQISQLAASEIQFQHDYLDDASRTGSPDNDGSSTNRFDEATRNAIASNCIMIQLFAIAEEFEQNYEPLLPYMFTANPEAEYGMLEQPLCEKTNKQPP